MQGGAAGASPEAIAKAIADAEDKYPPPPTHKQLCSLRFDETSFDDAKKIFGKPAEESTDKTQAGLSYRYHGSISMVLSFDWHDGMPGIGTILTGIGSSSSLKKGFILKMASLTGAPYPDCWPHEEP
jgi:hypothetical protein